MQGAGWRSAQGASGVEFALVLPVLVLFVFGIIQFGIAFNRSQGMHAAAREGARLASIGASVSDIEARVDSALGPTTVDPADVDVSVRRYAEGLDPSDETVGTLLTLGSDTACDGSSAGHAVRVDVVVARDLSLYAITIPLLPAMGQTFPSDGIFRCED